ncbi:heat shock protein Hsp20 [Hydrogenivirga caldilitoris]|uniref:Heat shock protein Hsp20 n=1 Tax=Hydrogenivirga caldilitoris TaxID=246264 RepID=A0A497XSA4_9AQUI|nr:Hsp20/alpha crystallin family protein [Hydrogenivirga caldilitoris]RLJ71040.1 heat shock protein Hsp20 [Hydrogenivirga caldilitoris]
MRRGLAVWTPFAELERIRREFDRLLEDVFPVSEKEQALIPPVDVYETDSEVVIKAELPGVKKEDIDVTIKENTVHLKAERKEEKEEKTENIHRVERYYGVIERVIPLPTEVKTEEAKAEYKDGVLEIRVPKVKVSKEAKIQVS